ncbi:hypothetical protein Tco_0290904 [Tanacetum coccineum]
MKDPSFFLTNKTGAPRVKVLGATGAALEYDDLVFYLSDREKGQHLAYVAAVCASRLVVRSAISCRIASKVMDGLFRMLTPFGGILSNREHVVKEDITSLEDKDGDNDANGGNDDERAIIEEEDGEWICFLGGSSSSGTKKYQGSNSNDGGNIGDGVKIAGEAIGSGDKIEFSKELKELLPDEAGK